MTHTTLEDHLRHLSDAVPVDRLAEVVGTVAFEVGRGRSLERHVLAFDRGDVAYLSDAPVDDEVDVLLQADESTLLHLVTGKANAGLEYLGGTLEILGDTELALAVGGLFGVDPRALDPVDVASALGGVKKEHLRKVMSSGFRAVVLGEIFGRFPDFVNEQKARDVDLAIGFRLLGSPSGDVERYVVRLDHGTCTVTEGDSGGERLAVDATITCEAHDFLRLVTGHLNAVAGVLRGQLKVKGDKVKALALAGAMDIPQPR
ncbi:MAG: SCP2 sterol-binding domain-containing protein [Nocardioidaceae bacterium]